MENCHFFRSDTLSRPSGEHAAAYRSNTPFPHLVLDQFLPGEVMDRLHRSFLRIRNEDWQLYEFENHAAKKYECKDPEKMGDYARSFFSELNGSVFIRFVENLTGIQGLIPDPHLVGGGYHKVARGGFLGVHVDFNFYQDLQLERRINLILYLNKDWKEEYGGELELWNRDATRCEKKISPVYNRLVVFNVTDNSYHGYPSVVNCPESDSRNALALFYYTKDRPAEEKSPPHPTRYAAGESHTRR